MVLAHRRTLLDRDTLVLFIIAAVACFALAGLRFRRSTDASTKIISLILSGMWASQGVLMFGESCPGAGYGPVHLITLLASSSERSLIHVTRDIRGNVGPSLPAVAKARWPVEGLLASVFFGAQSLVFVVLGNSGFLNLYRPFAHLGRSTAQQMGLFLVLVLLVWSAGHYFSKGAYCKLVFPLDLFTIAFMLATSEDSGYAKMSLLLPILGMMARCTCAAAHFHELEEAPMALISLVCFYLQDQWGRRRDAYQWPEQRRQQQQQQRGQYSDIKTGGAQPPRVSVVKREPMLREVRQGEDGGVQGLSFVKDMQLVDEDGDEAMEFFDVTGQGLRKRTPTTHAN